MFDKNYLAPTGSTGNNTHDGLGTGGGFEAIAVKFVVEAAGSTPTVTFKVQGSVDEPDVDDTDAHWFDLGYVTDASDTIATTGITATSVGAKIIFLANPLARRYRRFRLVTSSNTNITYRAELYRVASR